MAAYTLLISKAASTSSSALSAAMQMTYKIIPCCIGRPPVYAPASLHATMIPVTQKAPNTCTYCRTRKQRCDRELPSCSRCATYVVLRRPLSDADQTATASFEYATIPGLGMHLVPTNPKDWRLVHSSLMAEPVVLNSPHGAEMSYCKP